MFAKWTLHQFVFPDMVSHIRPLRKKFRERKLPKNEKDKCICLPKNITLLYRLCYLFGVFFVQMWPELILQIYQLSNVVIDFCRDRRTQGRHSLMVHYHVCAGWACSYFCISNRNVPKHISSNWARVKIACRAWVGSCWSNNPNFVSQVCLQ